MKKLIILLIALSFLGVAGLYTIVLTNGPRMKVQPYTRAFQSVLPAVPRGTVTTDWPDQSSSLTAPGAANSANKSAANLQRGSVYYRYYCIFCHGERGDGHGPVGESFFPVPADLRRSNIKAYDNGQLLRALLKGNGHDPVLERIVDPRHRRDLMLFVRSL